MMASPHNVWLHLNTVACLLLVGQSTGCSSDTPEPPPIVEADAATDTYTETAIDVAVDAGIPPTSDTPPPPPPAPSCDVNEVLERNGCLTCHGSNADLHGGGLDLTPAKLEASLVGASSKSQGCKDAQLVNVDQPEASILLHAVGGTYDDDVLPPECQPIPMPLGSSSSIPTEDIECIDEWVRSLEPPEVVPVDPIFAAPAITVLNRVKYILDGGAVSAEELELASGPNGELLPGALDGLVEAWMSGNRFHAKRRQFLELHLQQNPSDSNYYNQFRNTQPNGMEPIRYALSQGLIRTAERIIDNNEDFRTIVTTNTWEVTTTTLLALKMADNPMVLKPNGVWPKNNAINDLKYVTSSDINVYDREADSEDWRTVTLVHNPNTTDMTTEEEILDPNTAQALRDIPDGGQIELRAPRLGFFTTPAFFQTWLTNRDNDFRVTINQAVIVATGLTFSPGDTTALTGDIDAVDPEVFPTDSTCYGCHKNLDPMRSAFLATYDNINTRYTVPEAAVPQAGFSFQGHSAEVNSLSDWAEALANHPNFALAWTLKVCQWASSTECSEDDEHIQALAEDFAASNYNLTHLFRQFFTSPLVIMTSDNVDTTMPGAQVSVARFGHYCHTIRARLADVRAAQGKTGKLPDRLDICRDDGPAALLGASLPKDQVVRGSVGLHQPRDYSPMVSVAFEGMCAVSALQVVEAHDKAAFQPDEPNVALSLMNELFLGFPFGTAQHESTQLMLQRYFTALTASPACETPTAFQAALTVEEPECGLGLSNVDALRDLWTMVCQSPSLTGVGL